MESSAIAGDYLRKHLHQQIKYDSVPDMTITNHRLVPPKAHMKQGLALAMLLALGGLAIAGPYGVLAWSENLQLLEQRQARIAGLEADKARLENLNRLLHPDHADADLVGELLRSNLNVVNANEIVLTLDENLP